MGGDHGPSVTLPAALAGLARLAALALRTGLLGGVGLDRDLEPELVDLDRLRRHRSRRLDPAGRPTPSLSAPLAGVASALTERLHPRGAFTLAELLELRGILGSDEFVDVGNGLREDPLPHNPRDLCEEKTRTPPSSERTFLYLSMFFCSWGTSFFSDICRFKDQIIIN